MYRCHSRYLGCSLVSTPIGHDFVPPIGYVFLSQAVGIPALAKVTFKTIVVLSFGFCQTNRDAFVAVRERTSPFKFKQQYLAFNRNPSLCCHAGILQRPFLIDELDMDSGDSISANALCSYCRVNG